MSLTRAEWEIMWLSIKSIERNATALQTTEKFRAHNILQEVGRIKEQIQQVIGQLE